MFIIISAGYCCCADSLSLYLLLIRMHARLFIRLSISLTQTVPLDLFILFIAIDIYSRIFGRRRVVFFSTFLSGTIKCDRWRQNHTDKRDK